MRFDPIDIFRGIALLQMIVWQIFDFFYIKDIYTDAPYYISVFNMPINGIGVGLFAFIAGASVFVSLSHRDIHKKPAIIKRFLKRYGGYILLSLVFSTIVFGFNIFYTWSEAIQGVGLAALAAGLLLLYTKSAWIIGFIGAAIIIIQPWLRSLADSIVMFPTDFISVQILINVISMFLNSTVRGFFSLSHLLPIVLFGILLGVYIVKSKNPGRKSLMLGLLFSAVSLVLHYSFNAIDYYDRSISYIIFYIGLSYLLFALISYVKLKSRILSKFGQASLLVYVAHFLLIYKPLQLTGLEGTFHLLESWMFTLVLIAVLYFLLHLWLQNKQKIGKNILHFTVAMERTSKISLLFSVIWFVVSIFTVLNFSVKGPYFYAWSTILFSSGIIAMSLIVHVVLAKKISTKIVVGSVLALIILGGLTYILWGFDYSLTVKNIRGHDVISNITITNHKGEVVAQTKHSLLDISLQKGRYNLTVESKGYNIRTSQIINLIGVKKNDDISQNLVLEARNINLSAFSYLDPTLSKNLDPKIHVIGTNILNELVNKTLDANSNLIFGNYSVGLADENFELNTSFLEDEFLDGPPLILNPNEKFIILKSEEVSYINNYINDYISLAENLDSSDRGLPKQFYLYSRDEIVSLGKMIFLFCEEQTYWKNSVENPQFFIPKEMKFKLSGSAENITDCYHAALEEEIPRKIDDELLQNLIYRRFTGNLKRFEYPITQLNSEKRGLEISFTFDIESGRYVPRDNSPAISPCESEDYSTGLEKSEIVCNDPEFVAWLSPQGGNITYIEYPYPQVSGILGYREILSYSERYGIPTTDFIVKKDILAFEKLEPELIERTNTLIKKGLIEIAAHTRYHTDLGKVNLLVATREIKESKKFLEDYFGVDVQGFRAPYLSKIIGNGLYEQTLIDAGYSYYSNFGMYPDKGIAQIPWNSAKFGHEYFSLKKPGEIKQLMSERSYIVTLDHPWNLVYSSEDMIHETPETRNNMRANIFTAISNGALPVMAKDITIIE